MSEDLFGRPRAPHPRAPKPPVAEPFLYRWSDAELEHLKRGANQQLLRTRDVWSHTTEDDERYRLTRRINSLAELVLKIEHLQRERAKASPAEPKPPDSSS